MSKQSHRQDYDPEFFRDLAALVAVMKKFQQRLEGILAENPYGLHVVRPPVYAPEEGQP